MFLPRLPLLPPLPRHLAAVVDDPDDVVVDVVQLAARAHRRLHVLGYPDLKFRDVSQTGQEPR